LSPRTQARELEEGYDDEAHEWKLSPEEFRKQLSRLGFVDASEELSDRDIEKLLAGPDRMYVGSDRLLEAADVFRLFDSDKDGALSLGEFQGVCRVLDMQHHGMRALSLEPDEALDLFHRLAAPPAPPPGSGSRSGSGGGGGGSRGSGNRGEAVTASAKREGERVIQQEVFEEWWEHHLSVCNPPPSPSASTMASAQQVAADDFQGASAGAGGGRAGRGASPLELRLVCSSLFPKKLECVFFVRACACVCAREREGACAREMRLDQ